MEAVDSLMQKAIDGDVFPGAVLLVTKGDAVSFFKAYGYANIFSGRLMTKETLFDLASLTKPLATTLVLMKLAQTKRLALEDRIGTILPEFNTGAKKEITIAHLLQHTSGLPDYRPYYRNLTDPDPAGRHELHRLLAAEPLLNRPGQKLLYSDLGFMLLDWIIETVSGKRINRLVQAEIYRPLGIKNLFFVDLQKPIPDRPFAATEDCPWRREVLEGVVHDENAYSSGGVAGHAGLFGDAGSVARLLSGLVAAYRGEAGDWPIDTAIVRQFLSLNNRHRRPLGFDTPSKTDSSAGHYFSEKSVGHLGFTGTSFWIDLKTSICIILLTNRVHPTRANEKIKTFRPVLHDAVMTGLGCYKR